jgi:catechol-2,3-dioxygenase
VTGEFTLTRLDHVSLNVRDRAVSIAWYRDVLGLEQKNQPRADDWPVFMGDFGAAIALFQAQQESPGREQESTGLRHVAFAVPFEDYERAREHVEASGAEFREEDHGSALSLYVRDPDRNVVELTAYR